MKIKDEFPNYTPALMFYIDDKHPGLTCNDSKLYSYSVPLANFKTGFDSYELTRHSNGGVCFSVLTIIGFKVKLRTDSEIIQNDIQESEWMEIVYSITKQHFFKEEYQAMKQGYVKKGGGCFSSVLLAFLIGFLALTITTI